MQTIKRFFGILSLLLGLGISLAGPAIAAEEFVGTWVLDAAKSKAPPGAMPDNATVVVSDAGGGKYKFVSDVSVRGVTVRSEITFAIDGKEYETTITPNPAAAAGAVQAFERVNATSFKGVVKMNGQSIATTLYEISADGRTMTLTTNGEGAMSNVSSVSVFDRK